VLKAQNLHASHHGSRTFVKDAKDDPEPYLEAFELIDSEDVIISVGPTRNTTTRTRTCSISTTIRSAQRTCCRRASREFARANPALYEAMFTLPVDLTLARSDPVLHAGFVEIRTALAPLAGDRDVDTFTEVFWSALHGLATLSRAGRLRPEFYDQRMAMLVDQFSTAP